ncbi:MAG: phosphatase PAP2 family protein [Gammaproteobacteria bacterium]|nr:phosphatase PAP2 family protein [Gammaproteobacteria bacterium]MDE2262001.1 phosphatase PAP2 family protein [Gammaproteobacteria bacterium]
MVKSFSVVLRIWLLSFVACAALAALCFAGIDVPVAHRVWRYGHRLSSLNAAFGATVILTLESAVVLGLVLARLMRGHISRFAEALAIACLASICAYGMNDQVLKPFFGVPTPAEVVHGARHTLNIAMGFAYSSFPSGHMVLAGAFAGVFMRLYSGSIRLLSALLALAAALLVVGDWHFVSDVIAGAFLGVSAGMLAGEGWAAHVSSRY